MSLMRIYPDLTQDGEFIKLGELGFSGSLNDRQKASLVALGYSGALPDMMYQFWLSGGVYPEGDPIPGGTVDPTSINVQTTVPFSQQFTASGGTGPYTWSVQAGSLPSGLTLSGDTISGTSTDSEGTVYLFTLRATDSNGDYVDQEFSGTIGAAGPSLRGSWTPSAPTVSNPPVDFTGLTFDAGDTLVIVLSVPSGSTPGSPTGFTEVGRLITGGGGLIAFTKVADGTETTVSVSGFGGWYQPAAFVIQNASTARFAGVSGSTNPPSVTNASGALSIVLASTRNTSGPEDLDLTPPTGYTNLLAAFNDQSAFDPVLIAAYQSGVPADEDPGSWTNWTTGDAFTTGTLTFDPVS